MPSGVFALRHSPSVLEITVEARISRCRCQNTLAPERRLTKGRKKTSPNAQIEQRRIVEGRAGCKEVVDQDEAQTDQGGDGRELSFHMGASS